MQRQNPKEVNYFVTQVRKTIPKYNSSRTID